MNQLHQTLEIWAPLIFALAGIGFVFWRARATTPFQKRFFVKQQQQLELSTRQVDQMKQSVETSTELVRQLTRIADALEKRQG